MRRRVFISYRHVDPDRGIAAAVAKSLHRNHDIFIDTDLAPGSLWGATIETELNSCDYILVFLSPGSIASPMVVEEIARAHALHTSVGKPVLLPVRLGLGPEVLLPYPLSAYVNRFQHIFWQPEDGTDLLAGKLDRLLADGVGRKVLDQTSGALRQRTVASTAERNRTQLIRRVRHDWIDGVLSPSLAEFPDLSVSLQARQGVPEFLIERPGRTRQRAAPEVSIIKVFDEHVGQLLILGAPGAGKTTLLLKLLANLLDRADEEPLHPIPAFFNLSSWAARRSSLESWLAEELREHYDVPRRVAEQWVRSDQILPILDGLDETDEHRLSCVEAVNSFRKDHGLLEIAITSREAEYKLLATKLRLPGCVCIGRLGREQIGDLVDGFDVSTREKVRLALTNEEGLWELLGTPLMLKMALIATQGSAAQPLPPSASGKQVQEMIVGSYIRVMLRHRPAAIPLRDEKLLRRVAWLAATMKRRNQSVFHLETLDLEWLNRGRQRRLAKAAFIVGCCPVFSLFGIPVGALLCLSLLSAGPASIFLAFAAPPLLGGVGGLLLGSLQVFNRIFEGFTAIDRWTWSPASGIRFLALAMSGAIMGTPNILVMEAVNRSFIPGPIKEFSSPNAATWRSLRAGFIIGVLQPIALCVSLALLALPLTLAKINPPGIFDVTLLLILMPGLFGLEKGIGFFVRHWSVRLALRWEKHATGSFSRFLDDAASTTLLRKVGGGYIFAHRILQEHLALMHDSEPAV